MPEMQPHRARGPRADIVTAVAVVLCVVAGIAVANWPVRTAEPNPAG